MIRRFRLEQKSHYERLVIAQRLSDMLEKFLTGRLAPLAIGAEQGGIEEWDDVVILHSPDSFEHLQVKRQASDFCTKNPDKTKHSAKASKGASADTEPAGSVIDSAFASLAKHAGLGTFDSLPDRQFRLTLVGAHLKIKKDLTVDHLDALCKLCRQDGLDLDELANRKDGPTERTYLWLTTWCGFKDWNQIRDTLCRVTIVCVGNDATLEQRSVESLGRHFTDPKRTLERLITYITGETSDVSALGCHAVVRELKDELRPDIETWAQYLLGDEVLPAGRSWSFAGTHDLGGVAPRSAQGVVEHMWSSEPGNRKLRIYAPYMPSIGANLTLPAAILRMALHLPNGSQSLMLGEPTWRGSVGHEVGYTLGCAESDLNNLPWLENPERLACALDHEFKTQGAARAEAEALASAMDDLVWQRLIQGVSEKLTAITDPALADAMETVWLEWLDGFADNPESRRKFLDQLLYPETEGKNAKHALRLGPRTLDLLVTAVETLLLVAVGVGGNGTDWASFPDCGQVLSIALKYWSGPAGCAPEVRELSDDSLMTVIGPSPAPVVILSGVSTSPSELLNMGMADDAETATSMAAERQPHLLVTRSGAFNHLRRGSLASVRQHFTKQWQDRLLARESAIEKNAKGL
ncbi:ABC-three component system protein [Phytopseudomonas dryadis]|uniref:ABC-three component systems C-terminal domain-containing protein n=1 Tax=Phytopseudomonas dryadis TaxID=2487520 RepID=A0ABY1ZC83_9GAMM|nr:MULTISPECIES: ABC-three component system protein [Pseudomonas]TBV09404.1 hypothetical protein DNK34_02400 [Pseudomonas dryadis]TBV18792.1 hypothetical protein DNK41_07140 [Pseudomonas sp. FRB 230]